METAGFGVQNRSFAHEVDADPERPGSRFFVRSWANDVLCIHTSTFYQVKNSKTFLMQIYVRIRLSENNS